LILQVRGSIQDLSFDYRVRERKREGKKEGKRRGKGIEEILKQSSPRGLSLTTSDILP
jgi:hypothetical protein